MLLITSALELDVGLNSGDNLLLLLVSFFKGGGLLLALLFAYRVASVIKTGLAVSEPEGLVCRSVKEVTVVGNDYNRLLVACKVGFQPCEGVNVKVVCGLVQHENVRLCCQKPCQGKPCILSARKGTDFSRYKLLVKAKAQKHTATA